MIRIWQNFLIEPNTAGGEEGKEGKQGKIREKVG
jgi:hypothetical protein